MILDFALDKLNLFNSIEMFFVSKISLSIVLFLFSWLAGSNELFSVTICSVACYSIVVYISHNHVHISL